jgi:GH24 family phage-related lysozyme (muramidase)
MGRPAQHYRIEGAPELPRPAIDSLLQTVLTGFESELRARIPGYDNLPDGVKMALLDMAYNLGPAGLLNGYPRLIRAVENGAWAQAAAASFRHGPGAARNQWTQKMFLASVVGTIRAEGESALKLLGYGALGMSATLVGWLRKKL